MRVRIGSTYSDWLDFLLGVPQGSILGPLSGADPGVVSLVKLTRVNFVINTFFYCLLFSC